MASRILAPLMAVLLILTAVAAQGEKSDDKGEKSEEALPAGIWKLTLPAVENSRMLLWLVQFEKVGGKWSGKVLAEVPRDSGTTLEKVAVVGDELRFGVKTPHIPQLRCVVRIPKDAKTKKLRGETTLKGNVMPVELEKTSLTTLREYDVLRDALENEPEGAKTVELVYRLLAKAEANKVEVKEVRAWGAKALRAAGSYGDGYKRETLLNLATILAQSKPYAAAGVQYAKQALRLVDDKEPAASRKRVLTMAAEIMEAAGDAAEAKSILAQVAKLDVRIKVKPFAGRKSMSQRVALVEMFSNSHSESCVATDLAFEALGKSFKTSEVVLLAYHIHARQAGDPLTVPESEGRDKYYPEAKDLPSVLFNGKLGPIGGGGADEGVEWYEEYVPQLATLLETPEQAELKVVANRKGEKLNIDVEVSKLAETGDNIRLRVALVEKEIAYKGLNGSPRHYHVLRHMPSGAAGDALKEKTAKKSYAVDLADLKKSIEKFLEKSGDDLPFPGKDKVAESKKLRVIAYVQDDKTKAVLQAVQADVGGE